MSSQRFGADLSHWQTPGAALIARLHDLGIVFAWVKTSDGAGLKDLAYGSHHARLGAAGIARGPYHFYRFSASPEENARNFLEAIRGKTWELPPALDAEGESGTAGSKAKNLAALLRFLELVERATSRKPIIYTGRAWWDAMVAVDVALREFRTWIARYPSRYVHGNPPPVGEMTPAPTAWGEPADVWQYSDTDGTLDRNVTTAPTLAALTRADSHPPTPTPEEDVLNMAEITESRLRDIIREETNDIRGGVLVAVDEGRRQYGSVRGWLAALAEALAPKNGTSFRKIRERANELDTYHHPDA